MVDIPRSVAPAAGGASDLVRQYDVIVIGAGVAGLAYTLRLPPGPRVALLTKGLLGESNTRHAQGGLAAAMGLDDDPSLHEQDTLVAGAGLCDPAAVRAMVEGGGAAVRWLVAQGTRFDTAPDGSLLLGREAAHGRWRILHAGGDATGAEIERALVAGVRADPGIDVFEGAFACDLIVRNGRCAGVTAQLAPGAPLTTLAAPLTVLAAGGAGQLWATSSNPPGATADGVAMALRAGVPVGDLEFVQFHPTVLSLPNGAPFLLSEAIRGEGAYLRDARGRRFMLDQHPEAELAPRDIVARGIQRQMMLDGRHAVDLDLRHLDADAMRARFPTIARELAGRGLDLATDLIPVAPAAHYFIGGVMAGTAGETALPGLLALGEASCTGVHGANRLASNSLLEGLVFGLSAADRYPGPGELPDGNAPAVSKPALSAAGLSGSEIDELRARLQGVMSRQVAVLRDADGLRLARTELEEIAARAKTAPATGPNAWELRNMMDVSRAVVDAALHREESRGAHFRADYPEPDPALAGQHTLISPDGIAYGPLSRVLAVARPA